MPKFNEMLFALKDWLQVSQGWSISEPRRGVLIAEPPPRCCVNPAAAINLTELAAHLDKEQSQCKAFRL